MRLVSLVAALLLAATVRAQAQLFTPEDKAGYDRSAPEAGETMTRWIGFMDQRHFEAAWDGMAQVFKKEQDRATWIATQYRYRQDTYVVKARRVISSRYTRTLRISSITRSRPRSSNSCWVRPSSTVAATGPPESKPWPRPNRACSR